MSQVHIAELREKARRARELAYLCSDPQTRLNLDSYACDLDAEAVQLQTDLDEHANIPPPAAKPPDKPDGLG